MEPTRVLLIDDNPTFLQGLQRFLSIRQDISVVGTAQNAGEALRLVEEVHPDIVLIDLVLPDVPGLKLIELLHLRDPSLGLIAVSMHNSPEYRDAALAAGAHVFVSKSDVSRRLIPALQETLDRLNHP